MDEDKDENDPNDNDDRLFLDSVASFYTLWLNGNDDETSIDEQILSKLTQKQQILREGLANRVSANENMRTKIALVRKETPSLADLISTNQTLKDDKLQFTQLLTTLKTHYGTIKEQLQSKQKIIEDIQTKIKDSLKIYEDLSNQLGKQELSSADVERIHKEQSMLQSSINETQSDIEQLKKEEWDQDSELQKSQKKLELNLSIYNENGGLIGLIPIDAKYSMNKDNRLTLKMDIDDINSDNNLEYDNYQNFKPATSTIAYNDVVNGDIEDIKYILSKIKEHAKEKKF